MSRDWKNRENQKGRKVALVLTPRGGGQGGERK